MRAPSPEPRTLRDWRKLARDTFGAQSGAVAWIDQKIREQGATMPVLAGQRQMLRALGAIHAGKPPCSR